MRTLFIGSTKRGFLTLKSLLDQGVEVVGIISLEQDAHEVERYEGQIRELAQSKKIPIHQTKWMKDKDFVKIVREEFRPDIALVVGCRILLPAEIYQAPPLGTLAVHDSYLPEYRGFAPLNWSIINGEKNTGVTLFYLSEETDAGDIVARKKIPIGKDEAAAEVYEKVCDETISVILKAWPLLGTKRSPRVKQNHKQASITCSRTPVDGCIDWNRSSREIYDLIRALTKPYPGAYTFFGGKRLTIWKAKPHTGGPKYVGRIPGRVVGISVPEGTVDVLTGDGTLRILELQEEAGPSVLASQVIRSVKASLGLTFSELFDEVQRLKKALNPQDGDKHGS